MNPSSRTRSLLSVLAVLLLAVVTACGGGSSAGSSGTPDPNGTLRVGTYLDLIGGTNFDPTKSATISDQEYLELIYGTLLRRLADGTYEPWLASAVQIVDPRTVRVELRDGVKFSDGQPYDAQAVRTGILRNRDEATDRTRAGQNQLFKLLGDIAVDGPRTLTFQLKADVASEFQQVLAGREAMVPAPAADLANLNTKPVGAGPFTLESFVPKQTIVLARNKSYYDPDHFHLGKVELVHTPNGPGRSNVLLAGQVDLVQPLAINDVSRFASEPYKTLKLIKDFGFSYLQMCTTKPPFDDDRVRRAVEIGLDRDAINKLLYAGEGQPAHGLWPADNPNYNPAVEPLTTFDPAAAKRLVAESGIGATPIEMYWPTNINMERLAEIVRTQLAAIGLTVKVIPTRDLVSEFLTPQKPGSMLIPGSRTGMDKYLRFLAPGAVQNVCSADRSQLVSTVQSIGAAPDAATAAARYQQVELAVAQQAIAVPIVFEPEYIAWNTERVGGEITVSGMHYGYDLQNAFVTKKAA